MANTKYNTSYICGGGLIFNNHLLVMYINHKN